MSKLYVGTYYIASGLAQLLDKKMGFHATPQVVAGIAIGAFVVFLVITVPIVIFYLRWRHRKKLARAQTPAVSERRLSTFSNRVFRIKDDDVSRIPGARSGPRRSLNANYRRLTPYTPMASRIHLNEEKGGNSPPRQAGRQPDGGATRTPTKSWPLPRRLIRSNGIPLSNMRRSTSYNRQISMRSGSSDISPFTQRPGREDSSTVEIPVPFKAQAHVPDTPPTSILRPKPLFHGSQRSISYNVLSESMSRSMTTPALNGDDSKRSTSNPIGNRQHRRASSLWDQDPGIPPAKPVPELPLEGTLQRLKRVRSYVELNSRASSAAFSNDPTVLNQSRTFSDAKTEVHSNDDRGNLEPVEPPDNQQPRPSTYDASQQPPKANDMEAARPVTARRNLEYIRSQRVSLQGSLPRSNSSGISQSWLDLKWSRNPSSNSLSQHGSDTPSKRRPGRFDGAEKNGGRTLVTAVSPSPLRTGSATNTPIKRASTSILQVISGNGSSSKLEIEGKRPSSHTDGDPFISNRNFNLQTSRPASLPKVIGHRRQNSIHVSDVPRPLSIAKPSPPISESCDQHAEAPVRPSHQRNSLGRSGRQTTFRPPSALKFDFQLGSLVSGSQPQNPRDSMEDIATYSPTLSMLSMYNIKADETARKSPNPSPLSTPSRPSRHPNRINAVFSPSSSSASTTIRWPLTPATTCATTTILTTPGESTAQRHSPTAYERGFNIFTYDANSQHRREHRISNALKCSPTIGATLVNSISASPSKFPLPPPRHPLHSARVASKIDPPPKKRNSSSSAFSAFQRSSQQEPISSPSHRRPSSPRNSILRRPPSSATNTTTSPAPSPSSPTKPDTNRPHHRSKNLSLSIVALRRMNSETSTPSSPSPENRKPSREHKRYISLGGVGDDDDDDDDDVFGDKPARDVVREAEDAHAIPPAASSMPPSYAKGSREGKEILISLESTPGAGGQTLRTPREGRKWWRKSSIPGNRGEKAGSASTTPALVVAGEEDADELDAENPVLSPRLIRRGGGTLTGPRAMPLPPPAASADVDHFATTIVDLPTSGAAYTTTRLTGDGRPRSPTKLGESRKKKRHGPSVEEEGKRQSTASGGWRRDSMIDEELDGRESSWELPGNGWTGRRRGGRESLYDARGFLKE